jgi:DnaJ homolog subfamily C member 9
MNAYEYYRTVHPEIQEEEFVSYVEKYKNSTEEQNDLIQFYKKYKGDISGLIEHIIASENQDIPRFITFYEQMFKEKKLKRT